VSSDGKALAEVGDGDHGVGLADDLTGDDHVGVRRVAQHLEEVEYVCTAAAVDVLGVVGRVGCAVPLGILPGGDSGLARPLGAGRGGEPASGEWG